MKKEIRIRLKLLGILFGIAVIIVIVITQIVRVREENETEIYITAQDVKVLAEALYEPVSDSLPKDFWKDGEELFEYGELEELLACLEQSEEINTYLEEHKAKEKVPAAIFYQIYDILKAHYDPEGNITKDSITVIGKAEQVRDESGNSLSANEIISANGYVYDYENPSFQDCLYQTLQIYRKDSRLLSIVSSGQEDISLTNVWLKNVEENAVCIFTKGYDVTVPMEKGLVAQKEQVADLLLQGGSVTEIESKTDKCTGRLVRVTADSIEVEGYGTLELAESFRAYKLFGKVEEYRIADLIIGYAFTDFVMDNGKVCAALVTRDGKMENIRVLLRNEEFAGFYHEEISLTADTEYEVRCGEESKLMKRGEVFSISQTDGGYSENRIAIKPKALTGKVTLLSVKRNYGNPAYRGTIEIEKSGEGFHIVNEVLLEEYLYSVVPSEMPAYYPKEALMAQAVCARTYAYQSMLRAGLGRFGAHVDDSTSYQVYNNVEENAETSAAVRDTKGQVMYYEDSLPGAYYYSTSCGYGSDASIWSGNDPKDYPYLQGRHIAAGGEDKGQDAAAMSDEDTFYQYITKVHENDYEKDEGWYRWKYEIGRLDTELLTMRLQDRYQVNPELVLTDTGGGFFESREIKDMGRIVNISVADRTTGGAADELLIKGENAIVKVLTEYNIRYILSDEKTQVIRQDESTVGPSVLLPSAYLVIEPKLEKNIVIGYSIVGGGYGHGVGMSQNAAKNMALAGYTSEEILAFFYADIRLEAIS